MRVICIHNRRDIDNKDLNFLTIGNYYDVAQTIEYSIPAVYQIIDDSGQLSWYSEYYLKSVEKIRESKLKELGI